MKDRPEFFFLREKPAIALLAIRDLDLAYASMVAKTIDSTVPHTLKILAEMEEQGLISSKPEGRIRRLDLTEHGQRAAAALSDLIDALGLGSRGPLWTRLARLEKLASEAKDLPGPEAELRLGPLRRDLARLKAAGDEDEELRSAAEALDESVLMAIGGGG
jgi:DNA-binding MarR family transcriptional regulator